MSLNPFTVKLPTPVGLLPALRGFLHGTRWLCFAMQVCIGTFLYSQYGLLASTLAWIAIFTAYIEGRAVSDLERLKELDTRPVEYDFTERAE